MFNEIEYDPGRISVVGIQELRIPLLPTGPLCAWPNRNTVLRALATARSAGNTGLQSSERDGPSEAGGLGKPSLQLGLEYLGRTKGAVRRGSHAS